MGIHCQLRGPGVNTRVAPGVYNILNVKYVKFVVICLHILLTNHYLLEKQVQGLLQVPPPCQKVEGIYTNIPLDLLPWSIQSP